MNSYIAPIFLFSKKIYPPLRGLAIVIKNTCERNENKFGVGCYTTIAM